MNKQSHSIKANITVREAWLISEALELSIKQDREERDYTRMSELTKLADEINELWSENSHLDHDLKGEKT